MFTPLKPLALAALALVPAGTRAQDMFASPETTAIFAVNLCMFPSTQDIPAQLSGARSRVAATGLPVLSQTDEAGMYGNPAGVFVVVTRTIDSLTCLVQIKPPRGDFTAYKIVEAGFDAQFRGGFPGYKDSIDDDPSPHVEGHDWIVRTPENDSVIITIDWGTEDGITIAGVRKKEYD